MTRRVALIAVLAATPVAGAEPPHWAFRPPAKAEPPAVRAAEWVRTPVDAFVLAGLETRGLKPAAPADPHTLLRRLHLDLVGLPPTPGEQRAFAADPSPVALAQVVDDLLARPQYGERWGRHWLDLARYAETRGFEFNERRPDAWQYRDYVIDALNADKPYDRFLTEQLASDELPGADDRTRAAALFLRLGPFDARPGDKTLARYDQLDDVLGTVGSAFLAQTLQCARCHDHKFEPVGRDVYYALLGLLGPLSTYDADKFSLGKPGVGVVLGRVLKRGDPTKVGGEVEPGVPAVFGAAADAPPPAAGKAGGRLWLAKWMTGPGRALTARVMANRGWGWHFGRGLVGTPNDFGTATEPPTHPELLDWLANDLVAGGWRLKRLHRQLVLSATYQQGSVAGPEAAKLDPAGDLLGRWRLRRLEAEAVRDGMLSAAGRLDPTMHGPGVLPPLDPAVARALDQGTKG